MNVCMQTTPNSCAQVLISNGNKKPLVRVNNSSLQETTLVERSNSELLPSIVPEDKHEKNNDPYPMFDASKLLKQFMFGKLIDVHVLILQLETN